jgi:hypothetical protein
MTHTIGNKKALKKGLLGHLAEIHFSRARCVIFVLIRSFIPQKALLKAI